MGGGAEAVLSLTPVEAASDWLVQEKGAWWFEKATTGQLRKRRGRGLVWTEEEESSGWPRTWSRRLEAAVAQGWI